MSKQHKKSMCILIEYAKNQGFKKINLDFKGISMIYWDDINTPSEILIERSYTTEMKVYLLLHELGHNEMRKDWDSFVNEYPMVAEAELDGGGKLKRRIGFYVSCLEEEYKAWSLGYELGKSLGIKIDDKKWTELKNKCIMGYIRFFGKK